MPYLHTDGRFFFRFPRPTSLKRCAALRLSSGLSDSQGIYFTLPYIDDINIIGASVSVVNAARYKAAAAFSKPNLPTEPSKNVDAGTGDYSIAIGLSWWRDDPVTVKPTNAKKVFSSTNRFVATNLLTPRIFSLLLAFGSGLFFFAVQISRCFSTLTHSCCKLILKGIGASRFGRQRALGSSRPFPPPFCQSFPSQLDTCLRQ